MSSVVVLMVLMMAVVVVLYLALSHRSSTRALDDASNAVLLYTLADRTPDGDYAVRYARNVTVNTTFADMARILLPSWYQATRLALEEDVTDDDVGDDSSGSPSNHTMNPATIQNARKVLLKTRDLLDVCSPVFPTNGMWKRVRSYFRDGYQVLGEYQDLDHAHVAYSPELWKDRRQAVLDWKAGFERFARRNDNLLPFFFHGVDPNGCYSHDESHLFWGELEDSDYGYKHTGRGDSTPARSLPCGTDLATDSLQQLGTVQLTKALTYWKQVSAYESVLSVEHRENFHNLRKELRSFIDEYDLVGSVMFPADMSRVKRYMKTLKTARGLLGQINDDWTAYDIYVTRNEHKKEQTILAVQIDDEWHAFLVWAQKKDLEGTIQGVMDVMVKP